MDLSDNLRESTEDGAADLPPNPSSPIPSHSPPQSEPAASAGTPTPLSSERDSAPADPEIAAGPSTSGQADGGGAAGAGRRGRCVGGRSKGMPTWGSVCARGTRWKQNQEMEDTVAVVPEWMEVPCQDVGGCSAPRGSVGASHVRFFGVYDGHGGSQVARYCARRIHEVVAEDLQRADGGNEWQRQWEAAFSDGFNRIDTQIIADAVAPEIVGSTAAVVVLSGCQIIASNCGDSRAILCRGNQIIQLTVEHKPDNKEELARIEAGGGKVIDWGGPRVSGILSMSRAIGDRYMRPWIIPVPETSFTPRNEEDECLILASDGLWGVASNQEVGELACRLLRRLRRNGVVDGESQPPAQVVADHLARLAYSKNSSDDISVIVVDLKCRTRRPQRQSR